MLVEEQIAERRLRARKETFKIEAQGRALFGDYQVFSPASKRSYRVALRGVGLFDNYCACPDYAVNTLGTCKHIEAVLLHARSRFGGTGGSGGSGGTVSVTTIAATGSVGGNSIATAGDTSFGIFAQSAGGGGGKGGFSVDSSAGPQVAFAFGARRLASHSRRPITSASRCRLSSRIFFSRRRPSGRTERARSTPQGDVLG